MQTEGDSQGIITEDSIVSGLERLAHLIEKENEVTKECQDLMQSIPQNEVSLTTFKDILKRKRNIFCIPSIYIFHFHSDDFSDIDKDSHRHILFAAVCNL